MKSLRWITVVLLLIVVVLPALVSAGNNATAKPLVIDVRTEPEWKEGHLEGAIRIPYEIIGEEITKVAPDKKTKIIVYCKTGRRSGIALDTLKKLGYEDVTNLNNATEASEKLNIPIIKGDK
jgi:phage shock protein E